MTQSLRDQFLASPSEDETNADQRASLRDQFLSAQAPTRPLLTRPTPPSDDGDFMRGLKRTLPELKQLAGGTLAAVGDVTGWDGLRDKGLEIYRNQENSLRPLIRPTDSASEAWNQVKQGNFGAGVDFLQNAAGYTTGQALESLTAMGAGAALGAAVTPELAGAGSIPGAIGGFVGRQALKRGVKRQAEKIIAEQVAQGVARREAKQAGAEFVAQNTTRGALDSQLRSRFTQAQINRMGGSAIGGAAGAQGMNTVMELGSVYPEAYQGAQEEGRQMTPGEKARAVGGALAAAGVESAADLFNVGRLGHALREAGTGAGERTLRQAAKDYGKRALVEVPEGMLREAGTEAVQTGLERFGARQNLTDAEAMRDYIDSAAVGAVGGGLFGGAAAIRKPSRPQVMVDPQTGEAKPVPSAGNGPISGAVNAGVENGAIPSVPKPTPTITAQEVTARAQAKLDALNLAANGTPDTQTVDDAGNAVTVPGERPRILADNEKALRTFLTENIGNPQALADRLGMALHDVPFPDAVAGTLADAGNVIPQPTNSVVVNETSSGEQQSPRVSRWMNDAGVPRAPTHEEAVDYLRQKLLDNGFAQTRQVRKKDIRALVDADGETMVARTFNPALDEAARSLARELNAASDAQATAPRQPTTEPQNGGRFIEPGSTTSEGLPTDGQANPLESGRTASANPVVADAAAQPAVVPVVGDQAQVSTATDANPAVSPETRASAASQAASLQPLPQEAATAPTDSAEIGSKSVANQAAPRAETAAPSTTTTQEPTPKTGVGVTPTATGATAQPQSAVAPTTTLRAGVRRYSPTAQTAQAYYQPGRVVPSYYGQDRVLAFRPEADGKPWAVQVQAVDKAGNPTGEPRWHATFPEKKELNAVLGAASQYSPKALKDRAASLAQGASTPANESQPIAQTVESEDGQAATEPTAIRIEPLGAKGLLVHGDHADVRAKLQAAGFKKKGRVQDGALRFDAADRPAIEAALRPADVATDAGNVNTSGEAREVAPTAPSQQQAGRKVTLNKMERTTEGVAGKRVRDSRGEGIVLNANALDDSFNVRWLTGDYAGEEQRVTLGDAADVEVLNPRDPYDPEAMRKLRRQWAKEDAAKTAAATEAEKARVATEVAGMEQEARENGPLVKKALAGTEAQREAAQSYIEGEIELDEFKQVMSAANQKPNTEDAGEELWANRRNSTGKGLQWADIEDLNPTLKAREAVKSKVWPRPNYEQLVEGGIPAPMARIIKSVYDAIATKPQTSKAPTDEDYQAYIAGVQKVRDAAFAWARAAMEKAPAEDNKDVVEFGEKHGLAAKDVAALVGVMLKRGGDGYMLDAVFPYDAQTERSRFRAGTLRTNANNDLALLLGGRKLTGAMQVIPQDIMAAIRDVQKGWPSPQEAWEKTYTIHEDKVGDRKFRNGETITITEPSFWIAAKQGRFNLIVAEGFKTREDAAAAAKALYEKKRKKGGDGAKSEAPVDLKDTREGPQRRQSNEDITSDKLRDTFGFKGVNFGNWMKGASKAKMAERQAHLNNAYDALLDLAEILNIPPKAISLNGMLGLAIGAQGSGGRAAAHFVPGVNEINLTRAQGAGSLAHEWAHALDHYFATLAGGRVATGRTPFLSEHTADKHDGVRPEVQEAFKAIVKAMRGRDMTPEEVAEQERAMLESAKRSLERSLAFMRDGLANGTLKTGTGRSRENVLATFDELATRLRNGDLGEGYLKHGKGFNDSEPQVVAMLAMLYRESLGYKYQDIPALGYNARRVAEGGKAKQSNATHIPQVPSNFRREALKLDKGSTGKYWSSTLEMFARSFQSYVLDRLAAQGARNDYLTRPQMDEATLKVAQEMGIGEDGDRYPRGDERNAINRGFDTLVASLRTRETDGGNVALENVEDSATEWLSNMEADESRTGGDFDADRLGLRGAVNALLGKSGLRVEYLRGYAGLPGNLRNAVESRNAMGRKGQTAALYDTATKRVFVFTHVVRTPERAAWNAAHEIAGHDGLRKLLGKRLDEVLELADKNPTVAALADEIAVQRKLRGDQRLLAVEEALAELAAAVRTGDYGRIQEKYKIAVPEGIRARVAQVVTNFLRRLKDLLQNRTGVVFKDADVRALLENAWQAAQGEPTITVRLPNGASIMEQVVFHGTPHTVDKFSLQKIGTGEGAQAYGWGIYFASRREIAEWYAENVRTDAIFGALILSTPVEQRIRGWMQEADRNGDSMAAGVYDELLAGDLTPAVLRRQYANSLRDGEIEQSEHDQAVAAIERAEQLLEGRGQLYHAEIPEDSDLLDWDKPLSEQPEKVKDALRRNGLDDVFTETGTNAARLIRALADVAGLADWAKRDLLAEAARVEKYDDPARVRAVVVSMPSEFGIASKDTLFGDAGAKFIEFVNSIRDATVTGGTNGRALYTMLSSQLGSQQAASEALLRAGIPGLRYLDGNSRSKGEGSANYVIWDENAIGQPESALESTDGEVPPNRGRIEAFRDMTREQFLGAPKITSDSNASGLEPTELRDLGKVPMVPFMRVPTKRGWRDLTARYDEDGAAVYDGDRVIASYNFGDTLVVDKAYRRKTIAEELVYQWRTRNPNAKPAKYRTRGAQSVQEAVWGRIQRDLRRIDDPLESTEAQTQSEADNQSILRSRSVRAEQTPADAGVSRSGLSMAEGQRLKKELTAHWGENAPNVVLVESGDALRDVARQQGVDPTEIDERVEGLYLGKPTVWLNLSAIHTPERFAKVLAHEAAGHYGVEQVVGEQEWAAITDAVNRHVDNKTGAKDVQAAIAQLRRTQAGIFTIKDAALRRQTIAKEVIAVMTENGSRNGLVMRVIAAVRRFLRKLMPGMAWRDADIRDLILQAHGFMREGRSNAQAQAYTQAHAFSVGVRSAFTDAANFAKAVRDFVANPNPQPNPKAVTDIQVTQGTPDVYAKLGVADKPFVIRRDKLKTILEEHPEITVPVLQQLVRHLHEPVAVFQSGANSTNPNGLVALTELEIDGKPVMIAMNLGVARKDGVVVNQVSSYYGRDGREKFLRNIGALRYIDQSKAPAWLSNDPKIKDSRAAAKASGRKILTDADVVKPFTSGTGNYSQAAPNFYSAMLEAVDAGKGAPKKADAAGWKGWLDGAVRRGEFRQAERDWLGVDAWLDGRDSTTRQEFVDFIRANQVQVQEVVLGRDVLPAGAETPLTIEQIEIIEDPEDSEFWVADSPAGNRLVGKRHYPTKEAAADFALRYFNGHINERNRERAAKAGVTPKYESYQLPGGENYRELLLTLPESNTLPDGYEVREIAGGRWGVFGPGPLPDTRYGSGDTREAAIRSFIGHGHTGAFKSSHFDQPNILAHVRFNERIDADGKRVLFLEEIQSDWHQQGRKRGYGSKWVVRYGNAQTDSPAGVFATEAEARAKAAELNAEIPDDNYGYDYKQEGGIADAPFKATDEWAMLAFKRMVRHAAENGFDRIAWTTGEQQAERYDLSKQVDRIRWRTPDEASIEEGAARRVLIDMVQARDSVALNVDANGVVVSTGQFRLIGKRLDEIIGKEIADKIMSGEPKGVLSGDGLKVGGSGMRGFYDKILPSAVNKWAKKFGGKVGSAEILTDPVAWDDPDTTPITDDGEVIRNVHAIDLTPAMRDAALQGLPLFSRAPAPEISGIEADMRAVAAAADGADGVVARIKQWLKDATPKELKDRLRGTWMGALTTRMLTTLGQDYFPTMRLYTDFLAEMQASRNEMQQEGEDVAEAVRKWAGKNKQEAERLFDVMHEATIAGIDPSEAYQPLTFKAGKQWIEVNKKNVKDRIAVLRDQMLGRGGDSKQDMMNEVKALRAMLKAEPHRKAKYPALVAKWNQLSPEAQQHYRTMRDLYSKRHDATEAALIQRINDLKAEGGENRTRVLIDVIRQQFEAQRRQGVYFPLQRFGQYFVAAEKNGVSAFQMYGSLPELKRAVAALRARDYTITAQGLKSAGKAKDAPSGTFVAEVIEAMDKAHVSEQVQDEIYQMYLQALPELSMRKHKIHRKSVPGWDTDALRAFSFNMLHGAHQIARLQYAHKLSDTIDVLQAQQDAARKAPDADTARITAGDHILEELRRRHEWIMNPQDSNLTNLITSAGFTYYLGVTPAAALVNLTQVPMITLPYLGSRFGHAAASKALFAAMKASARTGGHIQRTLTSQEEIDAHKALQRAGALDKTQVHNLAGIAEGGMAGFNPKWAKAMAIVGLPFHKVEVINREATGMAAFRLARAEGSFDEAVKFAADAIHETQFDYSNANRARYMQSGPAKVLLMFRQYSQNLTWHIGRMVWEATKHADPDVRRIARRNLAGVLGMSALFSGTLGLPLMSVTMGILNAIAASFGDDDEPWDAETEFRAFLNDMLGKTGANVVLHGAANAVTGADIASRVSYSDLWFRDADRELDGRGQYYNLLEQAAGPMGGVLKNALVGKQMIDEGHVMRGIETMMPKAIKDGFKALRYADEGVNNLRGDPIVAAPGARNVAAQFIGFTPAEVAAQYDENRSLKNYEQHVLDRRRSLMDAYAIAIRLSDADGRQRALEQIRKFNRAWPQIALTPDSIRRSMRARAKYDRQAENGIMLNRKIAGRVRDAVGVE